MASRLHLHTARTTCTAQSAVVGSGSSEPLTSLLAIISKPVASERNFKGSTLAEIVTEAGRFIEAANSPCCCSHCCSVCLQISSSAAICALDLPLLPRSVCPDVITCQAEVLA